MRFLLSLALIFISCEKNSSGLGNINNSECVDFTCWNLDNDGILDNYNEFQFNGSITSAVFANGISLTLLTNGIVRLARGFTSKTET